MKKATREGAYGTVCVMANGIWPGSVYDAKMKESPICKYLEAGGRVVWIGDTVFYYMQDDVHPQVFSIGSDGEAEILGVRAGWEHPCWNGKGEPKVTAVGNAWGLTDVGGATFAAFPEDVTAALSGFRSDHAATDVAVNWFKNLNPLYPWSGFISHRAAFPDESGVSGIRVPAGPVRGADRFQRLPAWPRQKRPPQPRPSTSRSIRPATATIIIVERRSPFELRAEWASLPVHCV